MIKTRKICENQNKTLVQTAIIYPKGLQYLMDKKFGQLEAFAHAKVNCQKMILNCDLDEPVYSDASSSKKAFFLDDEKHEIERIESSLTKRQVLTLFAPISPQVKCVCPSENVKIARQFESLFADARLRFSADF